MAQIETKLKTIKDLKDLLSQMDDKDEIFIDLVTNENDLQSIPLFLKDSVVTPSLQGNTGYLVLNFQGDSDLISRNNLYRNTLNQIKSIIKIK